jgi:hypothetical protein
VSASSACTAATNREDVVVVTAATRADASADGALRLGSASADTICDFGGTGSGGTNTAIALLFA